MVLFKYRYRSKKHISLSDEIKAYRNSHFVYFYGKHTRNWLQSDLLKISANMTSMHAFWRRYKMFTNRCLCIRVTDGESVSGRSSSDLL